MTECPYCGYEDASENFPYNTLFINDKKKRVTKIQGHCWRCPNCNKTF